MKTHSRKLKIHRTSLGLCKHAYISFSHVHLSDLRPTATADRKFFQGALRLSGYKRWRQEPVLIMEKELHRQFPNLTAKNIKVTSVAN